MLPILAAFFLSAFCLFVVFKLKKSPKFEEKENDKRIVVKLEKTDVDEFCMIFDNDIYYYFSLAQFNRAMKAINNGDE